MIQSIAGKYPSPSRIACSLCGGALEVSSYVVTDFDLRECKNCDLVYNADRNAQDVESVEAFTDEFFASYAEHPLMHRIELRRFERLSDTGTLQGLTVVDVGSGDGRFLSLLASRGAIPIGVELNDKQRNRGAAKGISSFATLADLEKSHLGDIDLIYCSHTLEHFLDPFDALKRMFRLLRPGGGLDITVPCLNKATFKLERFLRKFETQGGWGIFYPEHLTYFNRESLQKMVERAGFQTLSIRPGVLGENMIRKYFHSEFVTSLLFYGFVHPLLWLLFPFQWTPNLCLLARKPLSS